MDDPIARKLSQLGLDRHGVLSPAQKAEFAASGRGQRPHARAHAASGRVTSTRVAGTSELIGPDGRPAEALAGIAPRDRLSVLRAGGASAPIESPAAPDVPDDLALADAQGRAVGRIPRDDAAELAGLIDAGASLHARVTSVDLHRDWADVRIDVFADGPAREARRPQGR